MTVAQPGANECAGGAREQEASLRFAARSSRARCVLAWVGLSFAAALQAAPSSVRAAEAERNFRVELGTLFGFSTRQIEADGGIDRTVSNDAEWVLDTAALYKGWYGFSPGLFLKYDVVINRTPAEEINLGLLLRYTFLEHFWLQGGYMFLMRRWDSDRVGLVNTAGNNTGTFEGSHSKAWMFGLGAQYPLSEQLFLTGKLDVRIRYFDARAGQALANGAEYGGLSFSPYVGLAYLF